MWQTIPHDCKMKAYTKACLGMNKSKIQKEAVMENFKISMMLGVVGLLLLNVFALCNADNITTINWVLEEKNFTRLCSTKSILTVNGMFPGPALSVKKGDRVRINVANQGKYGVTIHWHGVKQPRNPWSDGPEYVTQCPIQPGQNFTYEIIFSTEEGTVWWHAHSDWSRATVHGPIIVHPKDGTTYPFATPDAEFPIFLASWWKEDVMEMMQRALANGGEFDIADAFTINGYPGDKYCTKDEMYRLQFEHGKTYLLRVINGIMNEAMFFKLANHTFTVVGMDGAYTKQVETDYLLITPGQTIDVLVKANQTPSHYYMASRAYFGKIYSKNITTALVEYSGNYTAPDTPPLPDLPDYNDTQAVNNFVDKIKALNSTDHPVDVPQTVDVRLYIAVAVNTFPCANASCDGPNRNRLAGSLNNVSFQAPRIDILQAYYNETKGIYTTNFPDEPPYYYNFTGSNLPANVITPTAGTEVRVLEYGTNVEIVFQGTNVLDGAEMHPMHLHGFSFYFVGYGTGNFNNETDPSSYNLEDPPEINTVGLPMGGWAAVRFKADNPGVWFMHCHTEMHASWGMNMAFIVKNGNTAETSMLDPPDHLVPCS